MVRRAPAREKQAVSEGAVGRSGGSIPRMRRRAWIALACIAGGLLPLRALASEQLLVLANQARAQGCKGHSGTSVPLRWSPALARAAARMAKREPAQQAVASEGYRLTRIFHATFTGYRTEADVARALAGQYCAAVTEPRFLDFGAYRQGREWILVLGAPFQLPQLADHRAVLRRVLALTNEARAQARKCGDQHFEAAPPLQWDEQLEQAAARHAQDMARHAYLDHRGRDGSTPAQRVSAAGYRWRSVGENVAAGQPSAEDVVEDWVMSPGHCANLMNPSYTELGASFAVNLQAREAVYWVQAFGRPKK